MSVFNNKALKGKYSYWLVTGACFSSFLLGFNILLYIGIINVNQVNSILFSVFSSTILDISLIYSSLVSGWEISLLTSISALSNVKLYFNNLFDFFSNYYSSIKNYLANLGWQRQSTVINNSNSIKCYSHYSRHSFYGYQRSLNNLNKGNLFQKMFAQSLSCMMLLLHYGQSLRIGIFTNRLYTGLSLRLMGGINTPIPSDNSNLLNAQGYSNSNNNSPSPSPSPRAAVASTSSNPFNNNNINMFGSSNVQNVTNNFTFNNSYITGNNNFGSDNASNVNMTDSVVNNLPAGLVIPRYSVIVICSDVDESKNYVVPFPERSWATILFNNPVNREDMTKTVYVRDTLELLKLSKENSILFMSVPRVKLADWIYDGYTEALETKVLTDRIKILLGIIDMKQTMVFSKEVSDTGLMLTPLFRKADKLLGFDAASNRNKVLEGKAEEIQFPFYNYVERFTYKPLTSFKDDFVNSIDSDLLRERQEICKTFKSLMNDLYTNGHVIIDGKVNMPWEKINYTFNVVDHFKGKHPGLKPEVIGTLAHGRVLPALQRAKEVDNNITEKIETLFDQCFTLLERMYVQKKVTKVYHEKWINRLNLTKRDLHQAWEFKSQSQRDIMYTVDKNSLFVSKEKILSQVPRSVWRVEEMTTILD
jgi:hypothetical protein